MSFPIRKSSELRAGDVVQVHGFLLRLESVRHLPTQAYQEAAGGGATYVSAHGVPVGEVSPGSGDEWVRSWIRRDGHWTVQGNDLVSWVVVPAGEIGIGAELYDSGVEAGVVVGYSLTAYCVRNSAGDAAFVGTAKVHPPQAVAGLVAFADGSVFGG